LKLLPVLFLLGMSITCFAQKQDVLIYLTNNGHQVSTKDSADFIRVISQPDSGDSYFNVLEYYKSEKIKGSGKSSNIHPAVFEGQRIDYYENGNKKSVVNYQGGKQKGVMRYYFPNGKIYIRELFRIRFGV
jgi:antitoxin component YwqK of YwqJK toxin-antitoxin module